MSYVIVPFSKLCSSKRDTLKSISTFVDTSKYLTLLPFNVNGTSLFIIMIIIIMNKLQLLSCHVTFHNISELNVFFKRYYLDCPVWVKFMQSTVF